MPVRITDPTKLYVCPWAVMSLHDRVCLSAFTLVPNCVCHFRYLQYAAFAYNFRSAFPNCLCPWAVIIIFLYISLCTCVHFHKYLCFSDSLATKTALLCPPECTTTISCLCLPVFSFNPTCLRVSVSLYYVSLLRLSVCISIHSHLHVPVCSYNTTRLCASVILSLTIRLSLFACRATLTILYVSVGWSFGFRLQLLSVEGSPYCQHVLKHSTTIMDEDYESKIHILR